MAAQMTGEDAREFLPVLRELRAAGLDPTVLDIEPNDLTEEGTSHDR